MMSYKIDKTQKDIEDSVSCKLLNHVRDFESFYFIAGAGSGKTHALIDSVNEIITSKHNEYGVTGQKLLCITYTNNAVDEIKSRIGDVNYVVISTIHSFLWESINVHMQELLEIHVDSIQLEIDRIEFEIFQNEDSSPSVQKLRDLGRDKLDEIIEVLLLDESRFYECYYSKASVFWGYLIENFGENLVSSIKKDYRDVGRALASLLKVKKFTGCITKIKCNDLEYQEVKYFSNRNLEVLHKNIIGHDTLLKYSCDIFKKYELLSEKIIDAHPFVFIDEFQDSKCEILDIFIGLNKYAKKNNKKFCLGFFGDPLQAIYNNGKHILNPDMFLVDKNINRRSHQNIVSCMNKIRGQSHLIRQEPIKIHNNTCDLSLRIESEVNYQYDFVLNEIKSGIEKWNINKNNKLTCLVLKNSMLAELCGFKDIFNLMYELYCLESPKGFEKVSSEFLFNNKKNAGNLPLLIFEMLLPVYIIKHDESASLEEVFETNLTNTISLNELIDSVRFFNELEFNNLYEYIHNALSKKNGLLSPSNNLVSVIEFVVGYKTQDLNELIDCIYQKVKLRKGDEAKKILSNIFMVDIKQVYAWISYVLQDSVNQDVQFMTCHASKGLEFDNVIVFLDDTFNRKRGYISNLFNSDLDVISNDDIEAARRLFYVSCSRAIKNLQVTLYTDNEISNTSIYDIFKC